MKEIKWMCYQIDSSVELQAQQLLLHEMHAQQSGVRACTRASTG
jgi:hypothetical protein